MKVLQPNQEFQEKVIKYNQMDSLLALGLFCIMCMLYAILAVLERNYPVIEESRLAGSGVNILMIISTILLVKVRKEKFSSIGLYGGKWKQSFMPIADLTINNIGWILNLFLTHIVLALIYVKTNSLYGCIIPHWMSNLAYNLVAR